MNINGICRAAVHGEPCTVCHAAPGQPCTDWAPGVHLCRICAAEDHHKVTARDLASVCHDRDAHTGTALILCEVA